jgi:serine/threonine-protein kinase
MSSDERLAEILGDWLEARDRGVAPDADALTTGAPELADELRRHLRLMDAVTTSAAHADEDDADDGPRLGRYRLERELGKGGMGTVHLAHRPDGTPVALKLIHAHLLQTEGFFKRFVREAEVARRIRHENVVRTLDYDAISEDGRSRHFLVMEYVEGQTLRQLLDDLDHVPEELCRHVAREVCKGLAAIHAAGAVHGDLKPENVIVTRDDVVKVMDVGVVRLVDESLRQRGSDAVVGNVLHAAPEQYEGGAVDVRTDLYALGLTLHEMACGVHPFGGEEITQVIEQVLHTEPPRLGDVHPELSSFFEELVLTLLAKDRADRFASADELLAVLEKGEDSAWWRARTRSTRDASSHAELGDDAGASEATA